MLLSKRKLNIFRVIYLLISVVSKEYKIKLLFSCFLMIICAVMEAFTVGAVMPFLSAIVEPTNLENFEIASNLNYLKELTNASPQQITSVIFLVIVIISCLTRTLSHYINVKLAAGVGVDLAKKALSNTLRLPYQKLIKLNSSEVIASTTIYISECVLGVENFLRFIVSIFITIALLVTLFIVNFKVSLVLVSLFGFIYLIIANSNRIKIVNNSRNESFYNTEIIKEVQHSLSSIREIILDNSHDIYIEQFNKTNKLLKYSKAQNQFLLVAPKFLLEGLGIIFISATAIILSSDISKASSAIPFVGLLAITSQKLLPMFQIIYNSWAAIVANKYSMIRVYDFIYRGNNKLSRNRNKLYGLRKSNFKFKNYLEFKNVSFAYDSNKNDYIIENINLKIKKGEKILIIGKTGSGKSTFIDIIMGFLSPTKGEIFIDNKKLSNNQTSNLMRSWQNSIALVPQEIFIKTANFIQNIGTSQQYKEINTKRVIEAAKKAAIHDFIITYPNKYHHHIDERGISLSGGQRQRIGLARAFYKSREILILDESTSALDFNTSKKVMDSIKKFKKDITIIEISHNPNNQLIFDRVFEIKNKSIIELKKNN